MSAEKQLFKVAAELVTDSIEQLVDQLKETENRADCGESLDLVYVTERLLQVRQSVQLAMELIKTAPKA